MALSCPPGRRLRSKGIAVALADGMGSSPVSHIASAAAVRGFLDDCCAASKAWSVRRAALRVLSATNAWLHAQNQRSDTRFDKDRSQVRTFSALILKDRSLHRPARHRAAASTTAHTAVLRQGCRHCTTLALRSVQALTPPDRADPRTSFLLSHAHSLRPRAGR